jgi:hypothetical protein
MDIKPIAKLLVVKTQAKLEENMVCDVVLYAQKPG